MCECLCVCVCVCVCLSVCLQRVRMRVHGYGCWIFFCVVCCYILINVLQAVVWVIFLCVGQYYLGVYLFVLSTAVFHRVSQLLHSALLLTFIMHGCMHVCTVLYSIRFYIVTHTCIPHYSTAFHSNIYGCIPHCCKVCIPWCCLYVCIPMCYRRLYSTLSPAFVFLSVFLRLHFVVFRCISLCYPHLLYSAEFHYMPWYYLYLYSIAFHIVIHPWILLYSIAFHCMIHVCILSATYVCIPYNLLHFRLLSTLVVYSFAFHSVGYVCIS